MKICSVLPAAIVHMQLCIQQAVIYLQNISSCYLSFYFTEFECFNIKLCDRWWFILLFYIVFKRSSNLSCNTFPWFPKLSQLWEVSQVVDKLIFMMKLNIVFYEQTQIMLDQMEELRKKVFILFCCIEETWISC